MERVTTVKSFNPFPAPTPLEARRFWANVERRHPNLCWDWKGACTAKGYGLVSFRGRLVTASRLAYAIAHKGIPVGVQARHQCHRPPCCNPRHLLGGTLAQINEEALCGPPGNRTKTATRARFGRRLLPAHVRQMRLEYAHGATLNAIGRRFHVGPTAAGRAISGASWPDLPDAPPVPLRPARQGLTDGVKMVIDTVNNIIRYIDRSTGEVVHHEPLKKG